MDGYKLPMAVRKIPVLINQRIFGFITEAITPGNNPGYSIVKRVAADRTQDGDGALLLKKLIDGFERKDLIALVGLVKRLLTVVSLGQQVNTDRFQAEYQTVLSSIEEWCEYNKPPTPEPTEGEPAPELPPKPSDFSSWTFRLASRMSGLGKNYALVIGQINSVVKHWVTETQYGSL